MTYDLAIDAIREELEVEEKGVEGAIDLKEASGCKCQDFCLLFLTQSEINLNRDLNNGLSNFHGYARHATAWKA